MVPSDVEPVLRVRGATKTSGPGLPRDVDLEVRAVRFSPCSRQRRRQSTLIKCISGATNSTEARSRSTGPRADHLGGRARSNGIGPFTDLALFDTSPTATSSPAAKCGPSWLPRGLQWMKQKEMSTRTKDLLDRLQIRLPDFDADVALMSGGQRQAVAVARAVAFSSKLVILDEPTAALGLRESARVLELVDRLRTSGVAVILISHSMDHVMAVADRAMVMRRGRKIGEAPATADNQQQLVSWIVGAGGSTTV